MAVHSLQVSSLPQVEFPSIQVTAALPGADPDPMASSVAAPLERQFGRIAGVTEMTSTSYRGSTSITLQFELDRDINGAARDVQAAINAARGYLPPNLPANPIYRKVNPADAPIMILALVSESVSTARMYDVAATVLQQRLSQVDGVGQVIVGGSSLPAVRGDLSPNALQHYGLSTAEVRSVLAETNVNRPKGQLGNETRSWEIQTNDQLRAASEYRSLVVSYRQGNALMLKDVAEVEDSVEDLRTAGLANGRPAAIALLFRPSRADNLATEDR